MFGLIKKIDTLRRNRVYKPPQSKCTRWVKLCSPEFRGEGFLGTLEIEASLLPDWIGSRFDHIINLGPPYYPHQLAIEYMLPWFRNADLNDESVTNLDQFQRRHLTDYALDFFIKKIARIYCPECKKYYSSIDQKTLNKRESGPWKYWTSEWYCSDGHLLHKYNHELHVCR
jgi:hypothetical protein